MDQVKIGRFIAEMRKLQNLTQRELADKLAVSDKTVSKWERGGGAPELSFMQPLCKVLKIDLNELFSGEKLTDAEYKIKAEENIAAIVKEAEKMKKNIVGGMVLGYADNIEIDACEARRTNTEFWSTLGSDVLDEVSLPSWGAFCPSEDKMNLLGDLSDKRVLEIGCGEGRSMKYVADRGATDLWGIDISEARLNYAKNFLETRLGIRANFVCAPMEDESAAPSDYFDLVYSVYGIGWTTDLDKTFSNIYSYLKKDGVFVFSWSHPIHKCASLENGSVIFGNSYFDEKWYRADIGGNKITLANRMLSSYINSLANSGFAIERLAEETNMEKAASSNCDFGRKALITPTVFVIKARKL